MWFMNFNDGFVEVPFASPSLNIYTVGCQHCCSGCHAKELQNINHQSRKELTSKLILEKLNSIPGFYKSICWLGGDPFFQFDECVKISKDIKLVFPNLINVVYTGYEVKKIWEDKLKNNTKFMKPINEMHFSLMYPIFDYIIDGKWNGKMLGQDGCNQQVWKFNKNTMHQYDYFNFECISYEEFKNGKI